VLVELEPTAHGATDLSGDAGAVGRLLLPKGEAASLGHVPTHLTQLDHANLHIAEQRPVAALPTSSRCWSMQACASAIAEMCVLLGNKDRRFQQGI
jgi:hypothetical protein